MTILKSKRYLATLRGRREEELRDVAVAMQAAAATFGQPHLHTGRGIRELRPGLYECRSGLDLRLLFVRSGTNLLFVFAGNHDQVRAYL